MGRLLKRLVKWALILAIANLVWRAARRAWFDRPRPEPPIEPDWPRVKVDDLADTDDLADADDREDADQSDRDDAAPDASATAPTNETGADDTRAAAPGETGTNGTAWVMPNGTGVCPPGYPVKVKVRSGIYHLPGMLAYDRTQPDRCYATPQAAEADGFRPAKR